MLNTASVIINRHYPIPDLSFHDFWDICGRFQIVHPWFTHVAFTIDGQQSILVLDESDVTRVLKRLKGKENEVRKFSARFYNNQTHLADGYGIAELDYRPAAYGRYPQGLTFYSDMVGKFTYYQFEEEINTNYPYSEEFEIEAEFGRPCEILALTIDLRGFSLFCEKSNIESPYTCGLMTAFYNIVTRSMVRFPPEMTKLMGDGMLAIWETSSADRELAVSTALEAAVALRSRWKLIQDSPKFSHGAPEGVGAGISFGLASHLEANNDYIGRPINIASRLCSNCPTTRVFVDRTVPNIPLHLKKESYVTHIKPYGRHNIWSLWNSNTTEPSFSGDALAPLEPLSED